MVVPVSYRIKEQQLWLSPERCIFWEEEKALILSDLHFGKTGHFRKSGIAVPPSVYREDLHRLLTQIQYFQPRKLLIVGDLFHSRENQELNLFRKWREDLSYVDVHLIEGNHDILGKDWYAQAGITVHTDELQIGAFGFIHDITESSCNAYCFSGHIHPGVWISGMGKQALRFPCFYFGEAYAVLPAFSRFTGCAAIEPAPNAHVFAIIPPTPAERPHIPRGRGRHTGTDRSGGSSSDVRGYGSMDKSAHVSSDTADYGGIDRKANLSSDTPGYADMGNSTNVPSDGPGYAGRSSNTGSLRVPAGKPRTSTILQLQ